MKKIRKYIGICRRLIKLIDNFKFKMLMAILTGAIGHIVASLIPTLGAYGVAMIIIGQDFSIKGASIALVLMAIGRAILKYLEQLFNHDVAFTTLAIIRDKVFTKLRELAPAKMEEKDSGEMISIITSDIELLEVFYAHTISPIAIAIVHTIVMMIILGRYSLSYAILLLIFHLIMAIIVPAISSYRSQDTGDIQRADLSDLNSNILDTFRGIGENLQYNWGEKRYEEMMDKTKKLRKSSRKLSDINGENSALSNGVILIGNLLVLLLGARLYASSQVDLTGLLVPIVLFMSSFGPVSALSALINNLILTLACGERVLSLMDEEPITKEIKDGQDVDFKDLAIEDIYFSYEEGNPIIQDLSLDVDKGSILGIKGRSGCGKSTILKLIMRFYDVDAGSIKINDIDLREINTSSLWSNISYVTQSTHIFNGTIEDNMRIAKADASQEEIEEACKKASIHDFIMTLPKGYETYLEDDQTSLSTGEAQRLSIARTFLRDSGLVLLDEPTANIDALNEGIVLKSIWNESEERAVIILSHKDSTLRIAANILSLD